MRRVWVGRLPGRMLVLLMVLGLVVAVAGWPGAARAVGRLWRVQRVVMPGQTPVVIDEPGDYLVVYEYRSVVDGTRFDTPRPLLVRITLTDAGSGQAVPLPDWQGTRYALGDYAGQSVVAFHAEHAGGYTLAARYAPGQSGPPFVLAVTDSPVALGRRVGAVLAVWLGLCTALASAASLVRRRLSRDGGRGCGVRSG